MASGAEVRGFTGAQAGMDISWVTDRIAVGGGIWFEHNMIEVTGAGITHIIDMQIEFDDTQLAEPYGVRVLWNPTDDDFRPKPPQLLQRGVDFALEALEAVYYEVVEATAEEWLRVERARYRLLRRAADFRWEGARG